MIIIPQKQRPRYYVNTIEALIFGAGNEIRTRDPDLGKVVLYQLSYSRVVTMFVALLRWAMIMMATITVNTVFRFFIAVYSLLSQLQ